VEIQGDAARRIVDHDITVTRQPHIHQLRRDGLSRHLAERRREERLLGRDPHVAISHGGIEDRLVAELAEHGRHTVRLAHPLRVGSDASPRMHDRAEKVLLDDGLRDRWEPLERAIQRVVSIRGSHRDAPIRGELAEKADDFFVLGMPHSRVAD
jgi:hypothetical protein